MLGAHHNIIDIAVNNNRIIIIKKLYQDLFLAYFDLFVEYWDKHQLAGLSYCIMTRMKDSTS